MIHGSRRITAQLKREGFPVNRKAVQRHMREMGIAAISPGPNLSKRRFEHLIYPYLLRGVVIQQPNQVWGIDITYIRMMKGWLYLTAVLDWYSRYVVSWELSDTLEIDFVCAAVGQALSLARPQIMNSDQGSQFTSPQYIQLLKEAGVQISMDGRGRAQDNIFTERLWRTIKYMCTCTNTRVPGKQDEDWVNTLPSTTTNAYTRHLPTGLRQKFTMLSLPVFPIVLPGVVKGCLKAIA